MNVPLGVPGNAGGFGGVTEGLREKGIDELITADGPAGLRLQRFTCLMPIGTALACTWNTELVEALHQKLGEEMTHYGVDVQLGPGMNLHRNPLCGRNFEYYSEDPLLTGKIAAAAVRGVQSRGHASCPKHFACNNQETRRNQNDSRLSERALREIYLRGFEICVRETKPLTIMTSYNKVNGVWAHYSYELATTVLRGDWGFEGVVITDWWMHARRLEKDGEVLPLRRDAAGDPGPVRGHHPRRASAYRHAGFAPGAAAQKRLRSGGSLSRPGNWIRLCALTPQEIGISHKNIFRGALPLEIAGQIRYNSQGVSPEGASGPTLYFVPFFGRRRFLTGGTTDADIRITEAHPAGLSRESGLHGVYRRMQFPLSLLS